MKDEQLIASLRKHHADADTRRFNVLDFLSAFGNPLDALMYAKLFWPDFVEYKGMIFLKDHVEDEEDRARIMQALETFSKPNEVEESFNRFLIPFSFFASGSSITNDNEDLQLAKQLVEMWRYRLALLFPKMTFKVSLLLPEETGEEATITVSQEGG